MLSTTNQTANLQNYKNFNVLKVSSGLGSGRIRIIILNWVRNGVQNLKTWIRSNNVMRIRSGSTTLVLSFQNSVRVQRAHSGRAVGSGAPSEDSQLPLLYGGLNTIRFRLTNSPFSNASTYQGLSASVFLESVLIFAREIFQMCIYVK